MAEDWVEYHIEYGGVSGVYLCYPFVTFEGLPVIAARSHHQDKVVPIPEEQADQAEGPMYHAIHRKDV